MPRICRHIWSVILLLALAGCGGLFNPPSGGSDDGTADDAGGDDGAPEPDTLSVTNNLGLDLVEGLTRIVAPAQIEIESDVADPSQIVFTLTATPTGFNLFLQLDQLTQGESFTMKDVNDFNVSFAWT